MINPFVMLIASIGLVFAAAPDPDILLLKKQLTEQQKQIDELREMLKMQQTQLALMGQQSAPKVESAAAFVPAVPTSTPLSDLKSLRSDVEKMGRNLGGFTFSGDFRYRFDIQNRHPNAFAPGLQNIRNRYRVRMNTDKQIGSQLKFHIQMATGPYTTQVNHDQDFGSFGIRAPFSLVEASVSYTPSKYLYLALGRMREVFSDDTRFVWDDDVRLSGFEQRIHLPALNNKFFKSVELRAGEYILTHPNTLSVPQDSATSPSPYARAGFPVGSKVGAANLFNPGAIISGDLGETWKHQIIFDTQVWRNPNQIALASTSFGSAGLVNNALGLTLSGPVPASTNGLRSPGGAMFTANGFVVPRIDYRLNSTSFLKIGGKTIPGSLEFQAARNTSASFLRDAIMGSISLGALKGPGSGRFVYSYAIKDANSIIGQFTDEEMGNGNGANAAVHHLRFDLGLTRSLSWQHLFFLEHARRSSNPSQQFHVLIPRGAATTFRYLSQLVLTF